MKSDFFIFFRRWFSSPTKLGALNQSGPYLARAMTQSIDWSQPGHVIEIGAGLGSFTRLLYKNAPTRDRLLVIEQDPIFCEKLRERFPGLPLVNGDTQNFRQILNERGIKEVNCIISGIPLLMLSWESQYNLIGQALSFSPHTRFIQFTYNIIFSPVATKKLAEHGISSRRLVPIVMRNLPPSAIWCYQKD